MPTPALALALIALAGPVRPDPAERPRPFALKIVDEETRRGVPLVELRTVNNIRYVTDSAGVAAIDEPGLFGLDVYFSIASFGYSFPTDGFGNTGKAVKVEPGGAATIAIHRVNLAERLYRVTGAGIYGDSARLGQPAPLHAPVINGLVMGSDSVLMAPYRGKLYWFWGDTNRPSYPLGNFHTPGATSQLPGRGGLDPELGVDLSYFVDDKGFAKPTARMPGSGPTWLTGLTVLREPSGRERMFSQYAKVRDDLGPGNFEVYQQGLVEFDDASNEFRKVLEFPGDARNIPNGHPFHHVVNGKEYIYFNNPFPTYRVAATAEAIGDITQYEAYTPFVPETSGSRPKVERGTDGRILYGWKRNTPAITPTLQNRLVSGGAMKREETILTLRDETTGRAITAHSGSVSWNAFRNRWAMIFVETGGTSQLGEVWYAEADSPIGPWLYTRRIATHSRSGLVYSFYNPKQHPEFDKEKGRILFFEGTYATTFSGNNDPTPRYDYNQIMYRLDLGRAEMALPVPVYELSDQGPAGPVGTAGAGHPERRGRPIAYYALDRLTPRAVPIIEVTNDKGGRELHPRIGPGEGIFYVLPFGSEALPAGAVPLLEFVHEDGLRHAYSIDAGWTSPGYRRSGRVLGYVWKPFSLVRLPAE